MQSLFKDDEQGTLLVLPTVKAMMCGVSMIFFIHPRYRLRYVDGSTEEAVCEPADRNDEFSIISAVQAKR
tara:strand:- start:947 stop:1156 length:210 start_codon:yes stop_codon:yes gene_type:complete